ncbi:MULTISPECIES: Hsp20/alpha crystallin family protein [Sphingomonadaceae]|uniref:Hsp20/alpha crystallin family protein n=1 Tax=Sphingomonadales TaxID=204457 RepID=UPI00076FFA06|nr:Hsp20/alpha crystallin family protein [Sphingobium sp. TKS]AMK22915.1 heat shock protein Hsp20 [Sphingobium sp. TKS]MCF8706654.1 Hsp20/alpha crystallin family protein [Rhizorhapis sp. SPR117]
MNDVTNVPVTKARPTSSLRDFAAQFEPVGWLRSEIDRLFDGFDSPARGLFSFAPRGPLAIVPALEMVDDEKAYRLTAELPGLDEKDVEINVADGVLSISGEKKETEERKEKGFLLSERRYGSFQRQIPLPADVDPEGIKAQFKDGVLSVTLAKDEKAAARTRKIAIEKA